MSRPDLPSDLPTTDATRAFRPAWAWTPDGLVRAPILAVDGEGRLVEPRGEPVVDLPGLLLPGLVNAHTHLELGPLRFPPGIGLVDWAPLVRATPPSSAQAGQSAMATIRAGAAAVGEVTSTGGSAAVMAAARLGGRVFHEVLGVDVPALPELPAGARADRLVPHGTHSVHPAVIQACAALPGPWTIHFDEDPDEAAFLRGEGGWIERMRRFGRDLSRYPFPRLSPARYLDALGVLSPRTLLVHATCTRGEDLDVVAASGARVVLCVRSNLTLTGRTPDVPGLLDRGVSLAVGTDSLASSPDLDVIAEGAALRRAYPQVDPEVWLRALTEGGADALDIPLGRLTIGASPGLLHVEVAPEVCAAGSPGAVLRALFDGTAWRRRWLSCPQR